MHNVFVSYHHRNDQDYKDELIRRGREFSVFIDKSVDSGEISDRLTDQQIRTRIRDEYLRDSTVTLLLAGSETKNRKHVDWELYSSMFDGARNKKSGILVVTLPTTDTNFFTAAHGDQEKSVVYPEQSSWTSVDSRAEYERRYPQLPDRVIDNLMAPKARISVVPWDRLTPVNLKFLIDLTFKNRGSCEYDLSREMRRRNS